MQRSLSFKQINKELLIILENLSYQDLVRMDSYLLQYERPLSIGNLVSRLQEEYFFKTELALYKKNGIEEAHIRYKEKHHTDRFIEFYNLKRTVFVRDFIDAFCLKNGEIDWEKLITFNSGK